MPASKGSLQPTHRLPPTTARVTGVKARARIKLKEKRLTTEKKQIFKN